ncbi:hypothetical protein TIFTF001_016242 [Ficus carica]|uniref:Glycoside hydrolase family 19 catalytic domain-containing protein n=1 Tax=Ficus carica TaxID=3494 RepID=A0AA88AT47_FICCA|nr:hypothetical protein TIFTF001_016242 [Ficus carica]
MHLESSLSTVNDPITVAGRTTAILAVRKVDAAAYMGGVVVMLVTAVEGTVITSAGKDCPSQGFYSYDAFITTAASFPGFCSTGDVATRKRELTALLAQTSQATTEDVCAWGYCHINTTIVIDENDYCTSPDWPCAREKNITAEDPFNSLSTNHNYGLVGEALGIDLINNPELVATDPVISFKTAIWFWMARHENKPSWHDVIINANSEASHIPNHGNSGRESVLDVVNRSIGYYKRVTVH